MKSIRSKLGQKGLTPHSEKEVEKKGISTKAKNQVLGKMSAEIEREATGIYEQMATSGQFLYDNYNTVARAEGMSLVEYAQRAMVFYTNYQDLIGNMEQRIKVQEQTIMELTDLLNPVRYRMKVIDMMIAQEGQGVTFSDSKIMSYLNAVDLAIGKDIVQIPGE